MEKIVLASGRGRREWNEISHLQRVIFMISEHSSDILPSVLSQSYQQDLETSLVPVFEEIQVSSPRMAYNGISLNDHLGPTIRDDLLPPYFDAPPVVDNIRDWQKL